MQKNIHMDKRMIHSFSLYSCNAYSESKLEVDHVVSRKLKIFWNKVDFIHKLVHVHALIFVSAYQNMKYFISKDISKINIFAWKFNG